MVYECQMRNHLKYSSYCVEKYSDPNTENQCREPFVNKYFFFWEKYNVHYLK